MEQMFRCLECGYKGEITVSAIADHRSKCKTGPTQPTPSGDGKAAQGACAAQEGKMGEWIAVEYRLPESGQLVLACGGNMGDFYTVCHWNSYKNWWQRGIEELSWSVTHWQPLPAPPQPTPSGAVLADVPASKQGDAFSLEQIEAAIVDTRASIKNVTMLDSIDYFLIRFRAQLTPAAVERVTVLEIVDTRYSFAIEIDGKSVAYVVRSIHGIDADKRKANAIASSLRLEIGGSK